MLKKFLNNRVLDEIPEGYKDLSSPNQKGKKKRFKIQAPDGKTLHSIKAAQEYLEKDEKETEEESDRENDEYDKETESDDEQGITPSLFTFS